VTVIVEPLDANVGLGRAQAILC